MTLPQIPAIDTFAMLWFGAWWAGYNVFARRKARKDPSLLAAMYRYREMWFTQMLTRENRIGDIAAINSLLGNSSFFASTTILILGGLIAMLGTTERIIDVVSELPFTRRESVLVWQIKILLLIAIFVYAFFKFTWSIRQFNFCCILVGGAPQRTLHPERYADHIQLLTRLASYSAEDFNQGLRGYYFALSAMTWFLHPWLFIAAAVGVVVVLFRREFRSRTLNTLVAYPGYARDAPAEGEQVQAEQF